MLRLLILSLVVSVYSYNLQVKWSGTTFFNGWDFYTGRDPTGGEVDYVSQQVAQQRGFISTNTSMVYIGCDYASTVNGSSRGRGSVRIQSHQTFNAGLFIIDLEHMPAGCGTWPAFWLCGPGWPNGGEIDIIEGINTNTAVITTLHTNNGCDMAVEDPSSFTGTWVNGSNGKPATNCFVNAPGQLPNQGCSVSGAPNTFGAPFNTARGGVYATEWTANVIRMWYFPRNNIPGDITTNPNPDGWGKPYANFELGTNCPNSHFKNQQVIINLTFCGQYAGGTNFRNQCGNDAGGNCNDWVKNNPQDFKEAYWSINYVSVFQN